MTPKTFVYFVALDKVKKNYLYFMRALFNRTSAPSIPHQNGNTVDYFMADIRQSTDYSGFGVQLQERNLSLSGNGVKPYRYGYQGSEMDNEVKDGANSYTTFFRQLDPRLGRWLSIDPKATAWESPYVSMGNSPIFQNDVLGDTVNRTGAFKNSKDHMEAYDRWAKTKSGQKFLKKYEVGGKFEHISVVFDVALLDETGVDGHGESSGQIFNKKTGAFDRNLPLVDIVPNGKDLVAGKDKVQYLKFIITLDTKDLQQDHSKLAKARMINTIVHETQHMEIEMKWLGNQNQVPGAYQQHDMMYRGKYKQERIDTFKEIEDLWLYDYNGKWKSKTTKDDYIRDKINTYSW